MYLRSTGRGLSCFLRPLFEVLVPDVGKHVEQFCGLEIAELHPTSPGTVGRKKGRASCLLTVFNALLKFFPAKKVVTHCIWVFCEIDQKSSVLN